MKHYMVMGGRTICGLNPPLDDREYYGTPEQVDCPRCKRKIIVTHLMMDVEDDYAVCGMKVFASNNAIFTENRGAGITCSKCREIGECSPFSERAWRPARHGIDPTAHPCRGSYSAK